MYEELVMGKKKKYINRIMCGDSIKLMKKVPSDYIDLIITDPPFAIDFKSNHATYNRKDSNVLKGYNEILVEDYEQFTLDWLKGATRILKDSGSMYIFSGWNNLKHILNAIDECNLILVNHLIWKYQFGVVTKRKYVTSHYHCLYVCKNDKLRKFYPYSRHKQDEKTSEGKSAHYADKEDVWYINREYWKNSKKTPTKLPAEIIKKILLYSSDKKDLVFDPFLGSGQVAVVSKMMKRNYLGFEIVPEYYEFINERLDTGKYII